MRDVVAQAVKIGVAPLLKDGGFRKSSLMFRRLHGGIEQFVHFQLSQANVGSNGGFYVNVGFNVVALESLGASGDKYIIGSQRVDLSFRLEQLIADVPNRWDVDSKTTIEGLAANLARAIARLLPILDRDDSGAALVRELGIDEGFQKVLRARIRYVDGDLAGAASDLEAVALEFDDRPGITVETLAKRNGLTKLTRR